MNSGEEREIFYFDWLIPDYGFLWDRSTGTVFDGSDSDLSRGGKRQSKRKKIAASSSEPFVFLPTDSPPFLVINPKTKTNDSYKPLVENPNLFVIFSSLEGTEEDILKFANTYGWLGEPKLIFKRHGSRIEGESIHCWRDEIEEMQLLRKVNEWVKNYKIEELKKVIGWSKNGTRVWFWYEYKSQLSGSATQRSGMLLADKQRRLNPEYLTRWAPNDLFEPAKVFLVKRLNMRLQETRWNLLLNDQNTIVPYIRPRNLLNALWLQFAQYVTGERRLIPCEICNKWMDVTDFRLSKKVHPDCSKRTRQKKWRDKDKGKMGKGKTNPRKVSYGQKKRKR